MVQAARHGAFRDVVAGGQLEPVVTGRNTLPAKKRNEAMNAQDLTIQNVTR
jgi:hypothetical protein